MTEISDPIPSGITAVSWTCAAANGAACPNASGSGALNETLATFPAGSSVTYTATVAPAATWTGTPTGTVTITDGSTTIGTGTLSSGQATFTTSALAIGGHTITSIYGGDTNFAGSTSSALTQTVSPGLIPSPPFNAQLMSTSA